MWENQNPARGAASRDDLLDNLLTYWIEDYFKKPNYLKLAGKPVLFVYHLPRLIEDLDGRLDWTTPDPGGPSPAAAPRSR